MAFPRLSTSVAPKTMSVGRIYLLSGDGGKPQLDYALVTIRRPSQGHGSINTIGVGIDASSTLQVRRPTAICRQETKVAVITGSSGTLNGVLMPGTTFVRRPEFPCLQKLHLVQLDGIVTEGDSGAIVVDQASGAPYGHIVSGCPGTRVAYIVAATEVFDDLKSRLKAEITVEASADVAESYHLPAAESPEPKNPTARRVQDTTQSTTSESLQRPRRSGTPVDSTNDYTNGDLNAFECQRTTPRLHAKRLSGPTNPKLSLWAWDPIFSTRRPFSRNAENTPFIHHLISDEPYDLYTEGGRFDRDLLGNLVPGAEGISPEIEELRNFLCRISADGTVDFPEQDFSLAWLSDVRQRVGRNGRRNSSGVLTSRGLYEALSFSVRAYFFSAASTTLESSLTYF
jgi:hypothetical protein